MSFKRHAVSIALVAVAFALGVYVLVVDRARPTTGETADRARNLFGSFRRDEITAIEIIGGGDPIRLARVAADGGASMYYLAPAAGEIADGAAVDRLISALEIATPERRLSADLDRRALGLSAPALRLTVSMGSATHRLTVGKPAPSPAGAVYADLDGEGVVLSRQTVADLSRPRDAYRARTLVPYAASALARLDLDGEGGQRQLTRGGWGGWQIASVRADRDALDRILASLSNLLAESFLADAPAGGPRIRVVATPANAGPRAVLEVRGECRFARDGADHDGTVIVRLEPAPRVTACVSRDATDALATPADQLIDRHLFSLRPDEVEEIVLAAGDAGTDIARRGTSWHMRRPAEGDVEIDEGNGLVRSVVDLVAERIDLEDAGAFVSHGSVTLRRAGQTGGEEVVLLGERLPDGLLDVRRVQDGARLLISLDAAKALQPGPLTLRSRRITDEPPANVRAIAVRWDRAREVLRRTPAGMWTLDEPRGFAPDPGVASDLAEALVQLRADRFVSDRDDGSYGFAEPSRVIDVDVAGADGGVRTTRILTGRSIGRGAAARRGDDPAVFVLSEATLRAIDALAIDRSYFMVDPAAVGAIELGRGKRLAAGDLEAAKNALSTMRTEGVVHLGPALAAEGFDRPQLDVTIDRTAAPRTIRFSIGAGDVWRDTNVFYARRAGVDATFAIAQSKVRPLFDLR